MATTHTAIRNTSGDIMISMKRLVEQPALNSSAPTVEEYMNKVNSYMAKKGNPDDWRQLQPHLALYYDKIADDALKQRMFNEIGTVTADPTNVKEMSAQMITNIYLNNGDLNNLGRKNSITTKPPYSLPLVNPSKKNPEKGGLNPGAGELSFQLAHPNILWVGKNYPGDAIYQTGDKTYVIDVKDETKLGDDSSGIDMSNMKKHGLKILYDGTQLLKLQKAIVVFMGFVFRLNKDQTRLAATFTTDEARNEFLKITNDMQKTIAGSDYTAEDRVNQMADFSKRPANDLFELSKHLVLAQTALEHTLNTQCHINQLKDFLDKFSDQINPDTPDGMLLLKTRNNEILRPWWLVKTFQSIINITDPSIPTSDEIKYDYVLAVNKESGSRPYYFQSSRDDVFITSFFNRNSFADGGKTSIRVNYYTYLEQRADELGLELSDITDFSADDVNPCNAAARNARGPKISLAVEMFKVLRYLKQKGEL
jgi:hypothetical protein